MCAEQEEGQDNCSGGGLHRLLTLHCHVGPDPSGLSSRAFPSHMLYRKPTSSALSMTTGQHRCAVSACWGGPSAPWLPRLRGLPERSWAGHKNHPSSHPR